MARKIRIKKMPQKIYKAEVFETSSSSSLTNGELEIDPNTHTKDSWISKARRRIK
jgi:hypothetical protein